MRNQLSARLIVTYLALCLTLSFTAGFKACSQSDKEKSIAWAKDIRGALVSARPLIVKLKPELAGTIDKIITASGDLIPALETSNSTDALRILTDLIPVFESIAAQFTDNVQVLTALALVDIGLHFLVNHIPATTAARAPSATQSAIVKYKNTQVWGCAYRPDKCER